MLNNLSNPRKHIKSNSQTYEPNFMYGRVSSHKTLIEGAFVIVGHIWTTKIEFPPPKIEYEENGHLGAGYVGRSQKKKMACGITPKKRIQGCKLAPEANLRWGEGLSEPPAVEVLTSAVDNFVHQSQHFL